MRAEKTLPNLNRSDLVRQRRSQRSKQRVAQTRQAASRGVRSQPVITRSDGYSATRPLHESSRSKVKRQYYYALGSSGAELRLPALPFMNLNSRMLSAMVVVLAALALYALGFSSQFQISEVTIDGISRLTPGDIYSVLNVQGEQVVTFDPAAARDALQKAFPELGSVKVQVVLPAKVHLQVTERQPAVAWNAGDTVYWIDASGVVLPPRGEAGQLLTIGSDGPPPLLPVAAENTPAVSVPVTGASPTPAAATEIWGRQVDSEILERMLELQALIPPDAKLVFSSLNGLGWEDPEGWDVYIGRDLANFDLKFSMYTAIITNLQNQGITPQDLISVEFVNAPFYR
jgi:cell division protein FtsQ